MYPRNSGDLTLSQRVSALEKQNKTLRALVSVIALSVATVLLMSVAAPKRTLEANEFVLRDPSGDARARLAFDTKQEPMLALYDSAGNTRILVDGAGPGIALMDASRITRAGLWLDLRGPDFSLWDKDGRLRAILSLADSANDAHAASLSFYDDKAVGRAALALNDHGPFLLFNDTKGSVIWSAPTTPTAGMVRSDRPRVKLESWESEEGAGIFEPRPPRQNAQALNEMPMFIQRCPQVAAVLEKHDGDYVLRFDHHYAQGGYSYGYTLFDSSGQSLGTGSNLALGSAVDAACKGILNDWSSKAR
jgi:hypothetical protein